MEINVELFDKICRVCLTQSTELKSLFNKVDGENRSLVEVLAFTANVDIKLEDSLPKQVCNSCESIMCKADAFKRRCLDSEAILNNVYRNATGCINSSTTDNNIFMKDDKSDLKQKLNEFGTYVSFVPANRAYKFEFDKKNIELQDFSICPTDSTQNFTNTGFSTQSVKNEVINKFDDADDFMDVHDDGDQIEITVERLEEKDDAKEVSIMSKAKKIGIRYQCYCELFFSSKEEYKIHLRENKCKSIKVINIGKNRDKLVRNRLYCQICDLHLDTSYAYKVHRLMHKDENTNVNNCSELYQCSFCLRKFKIKNHLAAHIQKHEESDNIKHVCEICKREFKYKAYLENHVSTAHSRTNGFTCDVCVQSFIDKDSLEQHKKIHENDKKHRCTVCNKGFYMLCTLKEHMRTHTGEKPFLCSQCGRGFSQKTNLAQHMRRHQGLKPFKCETCEKKFVSKGELDAHVRKHSGAHPFICDDCGNGFTTSSALVKHRRTHTGERPYVCDLCPMRFAASGTLKNHRRTHTGEKPYQCSYCEKAFVQRNDLVSHIRCHTGERPYICTQCGQSFRKASGLKTHVKMHIKDPIVGVNALLTSMHCSKV